MKKILFSLVFVFVSTFVIAQANNQEVMVNQAVEKAKTTFQLEGNQVAKVEVILAREIRNMAGIESLKTVDYKKFLVKKKGIVLGTEGSLKRIFSKEQLAILNNKKIARRMQRSVLIKSMRGEGASEEAIELKILELY